MCKRGRKPVSESRATELRQRLILWQQTQESLRPSLRALAHELRTSHALLQHYLSKLAKWQAKENWRRAREIRTGAEVEGRTMTPWEEQQYRVLDRRALRLFIEGSFENSVKHYEQEIEGCIKDGKMPTAGYTKLLRTIASMRGGPAADRAAQRAQELLQKYFSPEGQQAVRERLRTVRRSETYRTAFKARNRQLRLERVLERFEEIGGVILPHEGQVCYFIREKSALSSALVTELVKYREELQRILEVNPGKVDFLRVKAEICQRFPDVLLSPLDSH